MTTDSAPIPENAAENAENGLGEYSAMIEDYVENAKWITPAELPLVFHLRKLCRELDNGGLKNAALASAYLQAFSRLDKRRPDAPAIPGDLPGQTSIFDELGD